MAEYAIGQTYLSKHSYYYKIFAIINDELHAICEKGPYNSEVTDKLTYIFSAKNGKSIRWYNNANTNGDFDDDLVTFAYQEKLEQPVEQALRFDDNKLRFDLMPIEVLIELSRAYTMGAYKYGDNNFRRGMPWGKVVRCVYSHFFKWLSGKEVDEETGCHHLALAAWNVLTLLFYSINKIGKDTRHKFSIDENFNWVDNHMSIGLNSQQLEDFKQQYKDKRRNDNE